MLNVVFGNNRKNVTLKDRIDIDPAYLILFVRSQAQNGFEKALQVADLNGPDCKTNKIEFDLVNEVAEDLPNGKVYLIEGNYAYKIYLSDSPGTDITGKKLLEKGSLRYDVDTVDDKDFDTTETEKILD